VDDCTSGWRAGTRPGTGLDPWPGWPACRLILARFVPENCSSPSRTESRWTRLCGQCSGTGLYRGVVAEGQLPRYRAPVGGRCLAVADTFEALKQLRARCANPGAGKLSCHGFCRQDYHEGDPGGLLARSCGLKSEGNLNNEYGLPRRCFGWTKHIRRQCWKWNVTRGELARLAAIAMPDVGVVTRFARAPGIFCVGG